MDILSSEIEGVKSSMTPNKWSVGFIEIMSKYKCYQHIHNFYNSEDASKL